MNKNLIEQVDLSRFDTLPDNSRVWIYQSDKILNDEEAALVDIEVMNFTKKWSSHAQGLMAQGQLLFNTFIVLMVNESDHGASGCSIDNSVHFITSLGKRVGVDFMNRMIFASFDKGIVNLLNRDTFAEAYAAGHLDDNSIVFDNLVNTKQSLCTSWLKELGQSWHHRMV